jgi:tetratricopeptide (TPR) repeat protein
LLDEGEQRSDVPMRVSGLNKLGLVQAFFFDDRDTGLANLASSEAMAREAGIDDGLIEACINQCYVRTGYAEFDEVAYYMGEVTRLGTEAGATEPTLFGMVHHANTLCYLTEFDAALELGEKALAKAEELGNLRFQAELLTFTIPMCHLRNGDLPAATAAVERGMALATQIGSHGSEAFAAVLQGKLAMEQGYLEDALTLFRRVMTAGSATGVPYIIAIGKCVTGTCFLHIGGSFIKQARALHQEALDVMEQPTGMTMGAWMWTEIGQCQLATGEIEDARELFEKALTEKTAPMYLQRPGALAGSIQVALIDGDLTTARERLTELDAYVTERSMEDQMMLLMLTTSAVAAGEGDHESALSTLDDLVEAAEGAGMRRMLIDAHMARIASLEATGRSEEADGARRAVRDVADSIAGDIGEAEMRSEFEAGIAARLGG